MQGAFSQDRLFDQFRESQRRFRIRRSLRGGRKHARKVPKKTCVLQNVILKLSFRQRALPKRHYERMSQLRIPDQLRSFPKVITKRHNFLTRVQTVKITEGSK
jgi:hypothetical protein